MHLLNDSELISAYATQHSEEAFATLVERHISLVYSSALRQVRDPHLAEEITQSVFIILARKAASLSRETVLAGWLCRTAHFAACNALKAEHRRQHREQEAHMNSHLNEPEPDFWPQLAPLLDEAVAQLGEADRNAVVLRFYQQRSLDEVGRVLGLNADTAQKRVSRALERLRKFFIKRGVVLTTATIAAAISANSVQAAPMSLSASVSAVAIGKGVAANSTTLTFVKGALKLMAWTKLKIAVVVGAGLILAGGSTRIVMTKVLAQSSGEIDESFWKTDTRTLQQAPPVLIIRLAKSLGGGGTLNLGNKALLMNVPLSGLLGAAYDFPEARVILPADTTKERFDLMLTLPDHPKEKLQKELKQKFGLVARPETRDVDILLLKIKTSNAPGLKPSRATQGFMSSGMSSGNSPAANTQNINIKGQPISTLKRSLESRLKKQILDETGMTNRFDIQLQWQVRAGQTEEQALTEAVLNQLGLELQPSREQLEMLIVEHVEGK
ncbi:TIGR03435 family protein [Pedosphaera parvula]|uniref:RNA polymerase, sigma-24 subunit, ECF subfamily n=1 Tax=Pedosphaera parvula (strain Ellin514) TaxID=320771 RepID=B9XJ22_PEDPL|nr:TIGR03435 family protein [Pedosphaera parvula]EEF60249.1 RNA polymerase, sigma-24 subunit, ECF subfamily [Pedosphaera parvula Ellin514]